MTRPVALSLLITLFLPIAQAWAGAPGSICRDPSVIELMGVELQKHDHYARIEPCLIEEFPADAENTVLCSVGVHTVIYDARVLPGVPLRSCARHAFRARALLDGFVVDYLR